MTSVDTAQKNEVFSNKDYFSKCDPTRSFLQIGWHLLKKPLMENFIFCAVKPLWLPVLIKVPHLTKKNLDDMLIKVGEDFAKMKFFHSWKSSFYMQWKTRTVSSAFLSSRIQQIEFYSNNGPNKEINLAITFKKKEVKWFAQTEVNFLQLIKWGYRNTSNKLPLE